MTYFEVEWAMTCFGWEITWAKQLKEETSATERKEETSETERKEETSETERKEGLDSLMDYLHSRTPASWLATMPRIPERR